MADGHGGYRPPAHPAPVSGPGKYSRRTDGGPAQVMSAMSDQSYGQKSADMAAQRTAPMAGQEPMPRPAQAGPPQGGPPPQVGHDQPFTGQPLNAPSQRPDEPITAGAPFGAGPGPEVLNQMNGQNIAPSTGAMTSLLQRYAATDTSGIMGQLLLAAQARGA